MIDGNACSSLSLNFVVCWLYQGDPFRSVCFAGYVDLSSSHSCGVSSGDHVGVSRDRFRGVDER